MAMNLHDYQLSRQEKKFKKKPRLLKRNLGDSIGIGDIIGYWYFVGYDTSCWDLPNIDDEHYEEEKKMFNGEDIVVSVDTSDYIGSFAEAWCPRLETAFIEVYIRKEDTQEIIKIETKENTSVISGPFEQLHQWLSALMEHRSKTTKKMTE